MYAPDATRRHNLWAWGRDGAATAAADVGAGVTRRHGDETKGSASNLRSRREVPRVPIRWADEMLDALASFTWPYDGLQGSANRLSTCHTGIAKSVVAFLEDGFAKQEPPLLVDGTAPYRGKFNRHCADGTPSALACLSLLGAV